MRYLENKSDENPHLKQRFERAKRYLETLADKSDAARRQAWALPATVTLGNYSEYMRPLRAKVERMLAYPPPGTPCAGEPTITRVGSDSDGVYSKVSFELFKEGLDAYGLLIEPLTPSKGLVVSIHGGGGTPEWSAGLYDDYNQMGRMFSRAGYTVWMPACYDRSTLNDPESKDPQMVHDLLNMKVRIAGTTLPAIDAYAIIKTTEILVKKFDIRKSSPGKVISCGVSYGGFRALEVCALSDTFDACISSCYFNDRRKILERYSPKEFTDWCFGNVLATATDPELCRLVCPKPLLIEVGKDDTYFPAGSAIPVAEEVRGLYARMGIPERFQFEVFDGGHVFSGKTALAFLKRMGY